eukprot:SAG11_NODE_11119_length_782_cov_2.382138_2_plen_60_part_01
MRRGYPRPIHYNKIVELNSDESVDVTELMMMVYYCLSKRTPLLNTHTFTPVESELNTLSA